MKIALITLTLLLSACSSGPTVPDWQIDTQTAMARYTQHYLEGRSKLAQTSFEKARNASASTANINAIAHLELVKCGVAMAALDTSPCTAYTRLAQQNSDARDANYYRFLTGNNQHLDKTLLPSQYQVLLQAQSVNDINNAVGQIADPLSRLIAVSVSYVQQKYDDKTLQIAIDTASAQGWRRPLLVYLRIQEKNTQDALQLQQIQTRIELLTSPLKNQ